MNNTQLRALVVDDEAAMRNEIALLLEDHDFIVDTAANGKEGLEKLRSNIVFDVAVVDLKMPELDGLKMIDCANQEKIDTYIVILTGKGNKDDAIKALRLQEMVKDWFDKPILDMEKFANRVKQVAEGIPDELIERIMSKLPPTSAAL